MSVWLLSGKEAIRLDGIRVWGRPPVLAPPAWALAERVWEGIGRGGGEQDRGLPEAEREGGLPSLDPPDALIRCLEAVPQNARSLALVVPDGTRVGPWRSLLPGILGGLKRLGKQGSLLVAGGVHAVQPREALLRHLFPGEDHPEKLLEGWVVIQNGENEFRTHRSAGTTPRGTPVRLHPAYLEADWRILLGEISYHYFAGFGGGRKLVFPGLGEPEGIATNHRRALLIPSEAWEDPSRHGLEVLAWNPLCGPGELEGNPVHEDLDAAARLAPPHWVVTSLERPPLDPDPAIPACFPVGVVQGPYPAALDQAGHDYDELRRLSPTSAPAAMLCDGGGEPRDATFLQAHKSLQHAVRFMPRGGRLLLVAACRQGVGSEYLARSAAEGERFRPLAGVRENPAASMHLQTLAALRAAAAGRSISLWSGLPPETVRGLGLQPLASKEEALRWCEEQTGGSWGWLPRAERFLPRKGGPS